MARRCPECGLPVDEGQPGAGIERWLAWLVVATTLGVIVVASIWTHVTYPAPTFGQPMVTRPVGDGFSWEAITAIHDGASDGALHAAIVEATDWLWLFPDDELVVRFAEPSGDVVERRAIGWPSEWVTWTTVTQYRDAVSQVDVVPRTWASWKKSIWLDDSCMAIPDVADHDLRDSVTGRTVRLSGVLTTIATVLLATWLSVLMLRLCRRAPSRRTQLAIGAGMVVLVGAASILLPSNDSRPYLRDLADQGSSWSVPDGVELGLTWSQIWSSDDPVLMDRIIAGAIVSAVPTPEDDEILVMAFRHQAHTTPSMLGSAGWPKVMLDWTSHPNKPASLPVIDQGKVVLAGNQLTVVVHLSTMGPVVLSFIGLWWAGRAAAWLIRTWRLRRLARQRRCQGCRYPLDSIMPT